MGSGCAWHTARSGGRAVARVTAFDREVWRYWPRGELKRRETLPRPNTKKALVRPLICFYGDDFTGSTDALESLTQAGIRTALFTAPPTRKQLADRQGLHAIGLAGTTRP